MANVNVSYITGNVLKFENVVEVKFHHNESMVEIKYGNCTNVFIPLENVLLLEVVK